MGRSPGSSRSSRAASAATRVGFGAKIRHAQDQSVDDLFARVLPEDLLKFGLIPEFVGRLPVIGVVSPSTATR